MKQLIIQNYAFSYKSGEVDEDDEEDEEDEDDEEDEEDDEDDEEDEEDAEGEGHEGDGSIRTRFFAGVRVLPFLLFMASFFCPSFST